MLNRVTMWLIFAELMAFLLWAARTTWTPVKGAGAVLIVVSAVLLLAARVELGRSFAVRARAGELVTTGVYARLRNPIYVFSTVLFVGVALLLRSPWPMVLVAVLIPVQRARARREAGVLERRFGEEYRRYRARTWF